jgi:16S rRNA (uracil1498-N3)-methyltransferase
VRIPRVYLPFPARPGDEVELPPAEARHLVGVLRRGPGDRVRCIAAEGVILEAVIFGVSADLRGDLRVVVEIRGEVREEPPHTVPWTVAAAVVKGQGFDLAVRLASELGLKRLIPIASERAVAPPAGGGGKAERWRRIALEAAKQCGRPVPLDVAPAESFSGLLAGGKSESRTNGRWIALPGAPLPARHAFLSLERTPAAAVEVLPALFLVGPEGGFSPEEVEQALGAGFRPLGFPTPVLRTPTAVVLLAALGILLTAEPGDGEVALEGGA